MKNRRADWIWGVAFILLGVGFAGNAFGIWDFNLFFDGWWTLFLIVPCVFSIITSGFHTGPVVGLIVGVMLLLSAQGMVDWNIFRKLILPAVFVLIGLQILLSNRGKRQERPAPPAFETNGRMPGDEYFAAFGARKAAINNETFHNANATAVFGSVELDLRNALINEDIIISATAVFGGVEIFLPSDVKVQVASTPIFGGVSNKAAGSQAVNAPTVYVKAICMFGGVDIK